MKLKTRLLIKFLILTTNYGLLKGTLREKISQLAAENNTSTFDYLHDLRERNIIDQATIDYILDQKF